MKKLLSELDVPDGTGDGPPKVDKTTRSNCMGFKLYPAPKDNCKAFVFGFASVPDAGPSIPFTFCVRDCIEYKTPALKAISFVNKYYAPNLPQIPEL